MYLPDKESDRGTIYLAKGATRTDDNNLKSLIAHEMTHAAQHQASPQTMAYIQKLRFSKDQRARRAKMLPCRIVMEGQAMISQLHFMDGEPAVTRLGKLREGVLRLVGSTSREMRNTIGAYSVGIALQHQELFDALWKNEELRNDLLKPTISQMNEVSGLAFLRRGLDAFFPATKELAERVQSIVSRDPDPAPQEPALSVP